MGQGKGFPRKKLMLFACSLMTIYTAACEHSAVCPNILDIECFSHTIETPVLDEFVAAWVQLFSHRPQSCLLWRAKVGCTVHLFCKTIDRVVKVGCYKPIA